jgi:V8-like Glu-specific endopeptidase
LVGPDIIATAGHCVNAGNVTDVRFVFGFRMRNATIAETVISNEEIYSGVALLGREEVGTGPDWAVVRIDRRVPNHRIVPIRRTGKVGNTQAVHVIGHPCGLPTKFAGGAAVRDNQPNAFFVANLDTYGGNSGSPVFNSDTHVVEGILVRGETDFATQGNCQVSLVCPTTGCRGEDCTRTTEFENLVPATGA